MSKATQKQSLVTVTGISGYFSGFSGGATTAETRVAYDGGALIPDTLPSVPKVENITVTRHYDHVRDGALIKSLRKKVGTGLYTVSRTPTDERLVPIGAPEVYSKCRLISVSRSDYASDGSEAETFELQFTPSSVV